MSKEKEPIRSRRELREQLAKAAGAAGNPPVPVRPAPAPVDASPKPSSSPTAATSASQQTSTTPGTPVPAVSSPAAGGPTAGVAGPGVHKERESQIRARDRAALRAYKELVESGAPAPSPLPSRRALRQAQLDAERAPITSVNPVVPARLLKEGSSTGATAAKSPTRPQPQLPQSEQATTAREAAGTETPQALPAVSEKSAQTDSAPVPSAAAGPKAGQPNVRNRAGRRAAAGVPSPGYRVAPAAPAQPAGPSVTDASTKGAAPEIAEAVRATNGSPSAESAVTASASGSSAKKPAAGGTTDPAANSTMASPPILTSAEADAVQAEALAAIKAAGKNSETPPSTLRGGNGAYEPLPDLVPGGSYYPVSAGPPPVTAAPTTEELRALAAERAEAERAAILAERAQARERLAQESAKNRRPAADPTSTDNLAMVTPLEFLEVPGAGRPVLRPPTTTHVPIVTRATPRQAPSRSAPSRSAGTGKAIPPRPKPKPQSADAAGAAGANRPGTTQKPASEQKKTANPQVPSVSAERFDAALAARATHRPGPGNRPLTSGRSNTLKKAEAMATGGQQTVRAAVEHAEVTRSQMPPRPADTAHGLEPLDALTAGLRSSQRNKLLQWGSVIVGGAAFVAGVIMVIVNLAH